MFTKIEKKINISSFLKLSIIFNNIMESQIRNEINYLQEQLYRVHDRESQSSLHQEIEEYYDVLMDITGEYEEIKITNEEPTRYMSTFGDGSEFVDGVYDGRYNRPTRQCNCARCQTTRGTQINLLNLFAIETLNDMFAEIFNEEGDLDVD